MHIKQQDDLKFEMIEALMQFNIKSVRLFSSVTRSRANSVKGIHDKRSSSKGNNNVVKITSLTWKGISVVVRSSRQLKPVAVCQLHRAIPPLTVSLIESSTPVSFSSQILFLNEALVPIFSEETDFCPKSTPPPLFSSFTLAMIVIDS